MLSLRLGESQRERVERVGSGVVRITPSGVTAGFCKGGCVNMTTFFDQISKTDVH